MEGLLGYVHKQIEQAARDKHVKAVVLRINSPGGSITASDDLHRRLTELRDGNAEKKSRPPSRSSSRWAAWPRPAATTSPCPAKPSSPSGPPSPAPSASTPRFPNVEKLAEKYGVAMNTIKQGEIKDSGSPFKKMTDKEKQVWQDMVDDAYNQFLGRRRAGPPRAQEGRAGRPLPVPAGPRRPAGRRQRPRREANGAPPKAETRTWPTAVSSPPTSAEVKLIDKIGNLEDAIQEGARRCPAGRRLQASSTKSPADLGDLLFGGHRRRRAALLEPEQASPAG